MDRYLSNDIPPPVSLILSLLLGDQGTSDFSFALLVPQHGLRRLSPQNQCGSENLQSTTETGFLTSPVQSGKPTQKTSYCSAI